MNERGTGFVAPDLSEIVDLSAGVAPAPLVDEIVIDVAAAGTPCVVSLRCGEQEFGWHEVTGGLEVVLHHVLTLTREYGTRVVDVNSKRESVTRWLTDPLRELGFHVREVK
jgi:hypothetical protein